MQHRETKEGTGKGFKQDQFLYARAEAWNGLKELAKTIKPGDSEESIQKTHQSFFPNQQKTWHPPKVRFARDTLCTFRDKSPHQLPIKEGDIFFFDFGPVIKGHEADVGDTFCLGDSSFINPAKLIFSECESLWEQTGLSGVALYEKATELAKERGLFLNPKMAGHRLSDFPHALHHKGSLAAFESHPNNLLWVLEIHVLDVEKEVGYFYEDLLGFGKS